MAEMKFKVGQLWEANDGSMWNIISTTQKKFHNGVPQPIQAVCVDRGTEDEKGLYPVQLGTHHSYTKEGWFEWDEEERREDNLIRLIQDAEESLPNTPPSNTAHILTFNLDDPSDIIRLIKMGKVLQNALRSAVEIVKEKERP